ncbi:hypothetical protein ACIHCQ_30915 [Streptomyces sp. NPDC052236]|uniref:hypothetical protein n=1 Tax=Streptomyces sp. NPDC052236 TaxID=3365686 RepID=UPI0037D96B5B
MEEIVRVPGRPDRHLDTYADRPVRPKELGPGARALDEGFWQDGRRLVFFGRGEDVLWEDESDCPAFGPRKGGGTVSYCDGEELVELKPVHKG